MQVDYWGARGKQYSGHDIPAQKLLSLASAPQNFVSYKSSVINLSQALGQWGWLKK